MNVKIRFLLLSGVLLSQIISSMEVKVLKGEQFMKALREFYEEIETYDVVSPQIVQDFKKQIDGFDQIADDLPVKMVNDAKALVKQHENSYKKLLHNRMTAFLEKNKTAIWNAVSNIGIAMMVGALSTAAYQGAKMGTGNLATMEYSEMAQFAFTGAVGEGLRILSESQLSTAPQGLLTSGGSNAITQMVSGRLEINQPITVRFGSPSMSGILGAILKKEAADVVAKICNDLGGPVGIASKIQWRKLLIDQPMQQKELIKSGTSIIQQSLISNSALAKAITEVGLIACESALIGGLLSVAGLGNPGDQTILAAMGNAMLRGAISGTFSYASVRFTGWKPTQLAMSVVPIPGLSSMGIVPLATPESRSVFLHAATQTVINYTAAESGGYIAMGKKVAHQFTTGIMDKWKSTWENTQAVWGWMWSPMR